MFIINDILTYSIFYKEYECYHSLVLQTLQENHLYVELKKYALQLFGVSHSSQVIIQYGITVNPKNIHIC
jgi:hypothetical protein